MRRFTRGRALIGSGDYTVVAQGQLTHAAGTAADGAGTTYSGAVTNAALGDFVTLGPLQSFGGAIVAGYVSAAGTVGVRVQNETGGTVTWVAGTINYRIERL